MSLAEFDTISHFFNSAALGFRRSGIDVGIGDDGAVLEPPEGARLSMSMDLLVEGTHFPRAAEGYAVGTRALGVNLSDLAAMAAEPLCFTLGLSLPAVDNGWLDGFSAGLAKIANRFNCPLVGGDLTGTGNNSPIVIAIQVHGFHQVSAPVLRSTAQPGDKIFVTGNLGDGALGLLSLGSPSHLGKDVHLDLDLLNQEHRASLRNAYYEPEPRIKFALASAQLMTSCIDISDGLAGDLGHVLRSSNVGADVYTDKLPFSAAGMTQANGDGLLLAALFGGDDYELCFTAAASAESRLYEIAAEQHLPLHQIGTITRGEGLRLLDKNHTEIQLAGQAYEHFRAIES